MNPASWRGLPRAAAVILLILLILGTFQMGGTTAAAKPLVKLRVGAMPYQDYLSIWIGQRKGWFREEGVEIQIISIPWYDGVNEALAGDSIDLGSSTPDSRLAVYKNFKGAKLAFLAFSFEGFGLLASPKKFKSYDQFFKENGGNRLAALKSANGQLKGKTICFPGTGGSTTFVETSLATAGLTLKDVKVIDLESDEALAALYAGRCDAVMGGIPQRQKALKDGYIVLVTAGVLPPEAAELVGWAATNKYIKAHPEGILAFMRVWYRNMQHVKKNPDDGFAIIAAEVNKIHGKGMTVTDLKGAWQVIEFFPNDACEAQKFFYDPNGPRYWKKSYDAVMKSYIRQGIHAKSIDPAEVIVAPQFQRMYREKFGCL